MVFVVHPDRPPDDAFLATADALGLTEIARHPSGRSWVFADFPSAEATHVRTRQVSVLAVGARPETAPRLRSLLDGRERVEEIDDIARAFPDTPFLLATDESGTTRTQGSVTSSTAVFWSHLGDSRTVVASDDQRALGVLTGAGIDPVEILVRLSSVETCHPFSAGVVWEGVHGVPAGSWLRCGRTPAVTTPRWWSPPAPDTGLDVLTPALKDAARSAVARAAPPGARTSCDLSGGLDSTSICFFARETHAHLQTVFLQSGDQANTDRIWADRAATELGTRHHRIPYDTNLDRARSAGPQLLRSLPEGPGLAARYLGLVPFLATTVHSSAPAVHLTGHGGDELFGVVPAMPWSLIRSRSRRKFRRVLAFAQLNRKSLAATFRMTTRTGTPQEDLLEISRTRLDEPVDEYEQASRWISPARLPGPVTASAREAFRDRLVELSGRDDLALHSDRSSHQILESLLFHGSLIRRLNLMRPDGAGLTFAAPLLDEGVVSVALSSSFDDRFTGEVVKPLLAAARPATMSLDYFLRTDKGGYTGDMFAEYRAERGRIRALFADGSVLEEMGLLDAGALCRRIDGFVSDKEEVNQMLKLDLTERWLRAARTAGRVGELEDVARR